MFNWTLFERRGGYFIWYVWVYDDEGAGGYVWNATKTETPPINEAGYHNSAELYRLKGIK